METIIQQIALEFARKITEKALSGGMSDIDALAAEVNQDCKEVARNLIETIAEQINLQIRKDKATRKEMGLVLKERDRPRQLYTMLGELHLKRDYYFDRTTQTYVYPFDVATKVTKYHRIGDTVSAELVNYAADFSYAKAAKIVTGGDISRQSVRNLILKVPLPDAEIPKEKRNVETIYVYADEDHVHMQKPNKKRGKKSQIVPIITVAEGVEKVGLRRNKTIEAKRFVDKDFSGKNLWNTAEGYLYSTIDMSKVQNIIVYGDGAKWIKSGLSDIPRAIHVMDGYHFMEHMKSIAKKFPTRNVSTAIKNAIIQNDKEKASEFIQSLMYDCEPKEVRAVSDFKKYIMGNWDEIFRLLTMNIPGSSTECQVSHALSERFSRSPMGWSKEGLGKLSCIRISKLNGREINAEDFRSHSENNTYAAYFDNLVQETLTGAIDWSVFDGEPMVFDKASGTQVLLDAYSTNHGVLN